MSKTSKRRLFNFLGVSIVALWVAMIGLLIKKVYFKDTAPWPKSLASNVSGITSPERHWMEIYLKGKKIGYSANHINPITEGYMIQEEIFMRLNLLDQASVIRVVTHSVVDHEFILKSFIFRMVSGIVTFQVSGKVSGNLMILKIGEGFIKKTQTIQLSEPPMIGSGLALFFKGRTVKIGRTFTFPVFDPSTMSQDSIVLKVIANETLEINRIPYSAFRLEAEMLGQTMTFWIDKNGDVLKEQGFMGFTLVKSSAARATRDIDSSGGEDFYELASINTNKHLPDSKRLTYLKLKAEGLEDGHFDISELNQGRQRFHSGIIEVIQEQTPSDAGYRIPYSAPLGKMSPFLRPEFGIDSDHSAIIEKARLIIGKQTGPVSVAKRLTAWVYMNVEKRPIMAIPIASEVLKSRVGDCNEHTVLLTALLRATGIPARVCVGLVYACGGFYYHAWSEGYLGKWISMDPTLNQMPTDATHIKLIEGGLQRQVDIVRLIGKLKLKIVEYRYD